MISKCINVLGVLFISFHTLSQGEELVDELADVDIFYDTTQGVNMNLGFDMVRIAFGTPNLSAAFELNEQYVVDFQYGMLLLPYRAEFFGFETQVQRGYEFNVGIGTYLARNKFLGKGSFYLGLEYENWKYTSSSFEVMQRYNIKNSIDPNANFANYVYSLALDYDLQFQRILSRYGIEAGVNYHVAPKVDVNLGFHLAYEQESITFDTENSFGVIWNAESAGFGVNGESIKKNGVAGWLSVTLKFQLF